MKFLCFDDWLFHRVRNLTRRYHQPVWRDEHILIEPNAYGASGASVAPAPGGGYYLYYFSIAENRSNPDDALAFLMARSDDGLRWERMRETDGAPPPRDPRSGGSVFYDPDDADPARRYKATVMLDTATLGGRAPRPGEPHDASQSAGYLKYSPDGLRWTVEPRHVYFRGLSDTTMTLLRNPVTGCFQVMVRAGLGNRRIFQVESRDLETWTRPRLVLHPCPPDPRGRLFYGMPQFR